MIVKFITQLKLVALSDNSYQLDEPFYFSIDGEELSVPDGFVTDFASVPRVPIVYLAVANKGNRAAVVHDWLYSRGNVSREYADSVYYHALAAEGVNWMLRQAMYRAVRVFGASHYNSKYQEIQ